MDRPSAPILARQDQRAGLILELLERLPAHDLLVEYESSILERPRQIWVLLESDRPFRHCVAELVLRMAEMIRQLIDWPA